VPQEWTFEVRLNWNESDETLGFQSRLKVFLNFVLFCLIFFIFIFIFYSFFVFCFLFFVFCFLFFSFLFLVFGFSVFLVGKVLWNLEKADVAKVRQQIDDLWVS